MTQTESPRRAGGGRRAARRRRSLRRVLVVLLLLALVAAGLVWALLVRDDAGTSRSAPAAAPQPITSLTADLLPPISQTSARPAAADKATALVQVTAKTSGGGDVTLQVRKDDTWSDVDTATLDGSEEATLEAPTGAGQAPMRVVASRDHGVRSEQLSPADWNIAFEDQFTGDALDLSKWNYRQLGLLAKESGRTKSESSTSAVAVDNGSARLSMMENPARPGYYLNGHISTENLYTFTYGVSAARIKFHKPRGMHGGFWMQAPTFGAVPGDAKASGGEIDAVEYFGSTYPDGGLASFTYYRDKDGNSVKGGGLQPEITDAIEKEGDAWWKRYHVFSVEWTPEAYIFRVDGVETFRQTQNISGAPEFLVLSLLSSDWELPDLDESKLPADMKVDWVRVWQQPAG